jgi:hypothetical protein
MSVPVIRLYESQQAAESVRAELKRQRFSYADIHAVHPPAPGEEAATVAAIVAGGVSKHHAEKYAEGVNKGGFLIIVHPPFGSAALAEEVLDHFGPIDSGVAARDYEGVDYESDATPFSRAMGWKVLSHNPEPFSSFLGWKTLSDTKTGTYPATFKARTISQAAAPFSRLFGLPVLSKKQATISASSAVNRLSAKPAPFSALFGLPTLTSKTYVAGAPKLSHNPAPLSSALGLPVLTKDQD